MKKILIVLALAAASGSAMAWTESGLGGNVELGGGLNLVDNVTPWEVKVGDAQTGLDMDIQKGKKTAGIEVKTSIPILGIRTKEKSLFTGQSGFSPQIDFGGTVDLDKAKNGVSTLTLAVKGIDDNKIGILTAPLTTVGIGYSIDS